MNFIKGSKFKKNNTEYVVTAVWQSKGRKTCYEFQTTSWDEPVKKFAIPADEFERKITIDNYVGLN